MAVNKRKGGNQSGEIRAFFHEEVDCSSEEGGAKIGSRGCVAGRGAEVVQGTDQVSRARRLDAGDSSHQTAAKEALCAAGKDDPHPKAFPII